MCFLNKEKWQNNCDGAPYIVSQYAVHGGILQSVLGNCNLI